MSGCTRGHIEESECVRGESECECNQVFFKTYIARLSPIHHWQCSLYSCEYNALVLASIY